jgi:diadenosine tetraphosphate (Ap4A) HIT family hydrolase
MRRVSEPTSSEPTVFTRIIRGELPGRFVWRSDDVVAFLTIAPLRPGHVLVVPVAQIDRWTDVPPELWAETSRVAHAIGTVLEDVFDCARVGLIVAGLEVPHCHIHLVPIRSEADLDFGKADHQPDPAALDEAAERIRSALQAAGHAEAVA